ncbi:unnamed protein product, partial [Ilex paraguariensis]
SCIQSLREKTKTKKQGEDSNNLQSFHQKQAEEVWEGCILHSPQTTQPVKSVQKIHHVQKQEPGSCQGEAAQSVKRSVLDFD